MFARLGRALDAALDAALGGSEALAYECAETARRRAFVRDAVANDVDAYGAPATLAGWNYRQMRIASTVAQIEGCDVLDVLPHVAAAWAAKVPRSYAPAPAEVR